MTSLVVPGALAIACDNTKFSDSNGTPACDDDAHKAVLCAQSEFL